MATTTSARSGIAHTAARAAHELRRAEKLDQRPAYDAVDAMWKTREAEQARADGARLLQPPSHLVGSATTELVPAPEPETPVANARLSFLATLADPTTISVDASEHRAAVATRAGVLSSALDTAVSARATTSIEKMLCHHMAAVHMGGMELLVRIQESGRLPPVELARLTNAAARMFEVYQSGCLTLQKLKTSGKQTVVVQHVNVEQGGQAVVAGRLEGGRRRRRPKEKNAVT